MDTSSKPKQRTGKSKQVMIAGGVVVLIAVALGVATQRIAIAVLPHTKAQVVAQVCTADDIAKFNATFGGSGFKATAESITGRAGHESDASCAYMEYSYYMQSYNYTKARQAAARLESLVANGHYVNTAINLPQSMGEIKQAITKTEGAADGKSTAGEW